MSTVNPKKTRVGLFTDARHKPLWLCRAVELIARSPTAEIVLLVELVDDEPKDASNRLQRVFACLTRMLFSLWSALDQKMFGHAPDPMQTHDVTLPLGTVPSIRVNWRGRVSTLGFGSGELKVIQEHALDVAFWCATSRPLGTLSALAKHGVWCIFFGTTRSRDDSLAGFWEVVNGRPQSLSGVMALGESAKSDRVIYTSSARTYPYSFCRNRENLLRKSAEFGVRALRDLKLSTSTDGASTVATALPAVPAKTVTCPGNILMTLILARLFCRLGARALQKLLFVDQWVLVCTFAPPNPAAEPSAVTLLPPKDRFWADPFPVEREGRYYIFFEELMLSTGKGHLAVLEVGRDGTHSEPVRIIEKDYHLSYPFVFEWEGVFYMIPETVEKRIVELYRCLSYHEQWVCDRILIENIRAVDATLHCFSGRWWMFVNVSPDGVEIYDELHLYHADNPFGPWVPHNRNPVVSDVLCARPAGRLFERDGVVYRPSQVCAPIYGAGIQANRILAITTDDYAEEEAPDVLRFCGGKTSGVHTYNTAGALHVVDRFTRRPRIG